MVSTATSLNEYSLTANRNESYPCHSYHSVKMVQSPGFDFFLMVEGHYYEHPLCCPIHSTNTSGEEETETR